MRTPLNAHPQHDTQGCSRLLTLREVATLLRLSPSTLRNLVRRQLVPSYHFAGVDRLLFKPDEILALLQPTTPTERSRRGPRQRLTGETILTRASDDTPPATLDDLFIQDPSTEQATT